MTDHQILTSTWTDPFLGRRATARCKCGWSSSGAAVDVTADKKQHQSFIAAVRLAAQETGRA